MIESAGAGRRQAWIDLVGVGALALGLRIAALDSQLWSDEVAALVGRFRYPLAEIVSRPPDVAPHMIYDALAHISLRIFGEHAWAIRLPAVVFGVGGVIVLYGVGRRIAARGEALLASGLMAVSYHHVFFSQDARGYTAMIFFGLLAAFLVLGPAEGFTGRAQVAYVTASVLAAYSTPFGVSVPLGHAVVVVSTVSYRSRRGDLVDPGPARAFVIFGAAGALILALYAPIMRWLLERAATEGESGSTGAGLTARLVREFVAGLRLGFSGTVVVFAVLAVALVGTLDYGRRQPFALGIIVAPVGATAVTLFALRTGLHPRYLLIALPAGLLMGARGLFVGFGWAARLLGVAGARLPSGVAPAALGLTVVIAALPLVRYYSLPKQDFLGALELVNELAVPDDRTVAATTTGHAIAAYYRPGYPTVEDVEDLRRAERSSERVWVITSLERVLVASQPALAARLHSEYRLVRELPGTLEDGQMRIYVRGPERR